MFSALPLLFHCSQHRRTQLLQRQTWPQCFCHVCLHLQGTKTPHLFSGSRFVANPFSSSSLFCSCCSHLLARVVQRESESGTRRRCDHALHFQTSDVCHNSPNAHLEWKQHSCSHSKQGTSANLSKRSATKGLPLRGFWDGSLGRRLRFAFQGKVASDVHISEHGTQMD